MPLKEDGLARTLYYLQKGTDALISVLAICGCLCLFAIGGLILADVFGRSFRLFSIPWKIDVTQYLLYLTTFLAAPWVLRENGHVSVDILVATLPKRSGRIVIRFAHILGAACSAALAYYSVFVLWQSYVSGTRIYRALIFPEWYLYTPGPIIFLLTFIIFTRWLFTTDVPVERATQGKGL
jgi:TRAP-type transport system small permease protein